MKPRPSALAPISNTFDNPSGHADLIAVAVWDFI